MRLNFASICCVILLGLASAAQAAEPAGLVIAVNPGAFVERAGGREPLQSKSPIYVSDVVVTDATGKVQILFHDGFPISVTNAATGMMTQINTSGRAVEATPSGNVEMAAPTGHLSQSGSQVRQPVAAASSESQSSDSGSGGSSTASSGSSEGNGNPRSSASASGTSSEGSLAMSTSSGGSLSLPSTPDGTIGLGDPGSTSSITPATLPSAITDPQSGTNPASGSGLTAQYTGTLTNNGLWVGTFSLDANVSSGQVSNAGLNVTGSHSHNFTAVGGSGTIDGSNKFTVNNMTITTSTVPAMVTHGSAWMDGKFYGPGDSRVKGDWGSEMNGTPIHNNGKFDGAVAP